MNGLAQKNGLGSTCHPALTDCLECEFYFSAQFQTLSSTGGIWMRQLIYAGLGLIG